MTAVRRFVATAANSAVDAVLYAVMRWAWRVRVAERAQRHAENEGTR